MNLGWTSITWNHNDPGEILTAAVAVGVAAGGHPAPDDERDRQGNRGKGVCVVVQGVAQQSDGVREVHDHGLDKSGEHQPYEADLEAAHAVAARLECRVDLVGTVVRVRHEDLLDLPEEPLVPVAVSLPMPVT